MVFLSLFLHGNKYPLQKGVHFVHIKIQYYHRKILQNMFKGKGHTKLYDDFVK